MAVNNPQSVVYSDTVITEDLVSTCQQAASLSFEYCTSTQWEVIGRVLASLSHLQALTLKHCKAADALFLELWSSESLLRL